MRRHIAILTAVLCVGACTAAASASAGPPALFTRPGELLGHTLRFRGTVGVEQAGRTLQIQRQVAGGAWTQTASATVAPDGSFLARWRTDEIGSFAVQLPIHRGWKSNAIVVVPCGAIVIVFAEVKRKTESSPVSAPSETVTATSFAFFTRMLRLLLPARRRVPKSSVLSPIGFRGGGGALAK